jgi:tetratricopeptide (TPR) repeat protein
MPADFARAESAATAAVQADGDDPWAHHALGCVHVLARRLDDARAQLELALSLNPNFSLAQGYLGLVLSLCGRWEEAIDAVTRALRLSPRDHFAAIYRGVIAYAQFGLRNYEEAMRLARDAIRQRGDFVTAHRVLTSAAGMAGQDEAAAAALAELRRVHPGVSLAWLAAHVPIQHADELAHYLEGFRRAGLA